MSKIPPRPSCFEFFLSGRAPDIAELRTYVEQLEEIAKADQFPDAGKMVPPPAPRFEIVGDAITHTVTGERMTDQNQLLRDIAEFNRYFISANSAAPNARISVPTSEWQALHASLTAALSHPAQPAPAQPQGAGEAVRKALEDLEDAAIQLASYVEVDTAPCTLPKYLAPHIENVLASIRVPEANFGNTPPASREQGAGEALNLGPWHEGAPPFPQDQEWFIAETRYGDRVVLRSLDEGREHKGRYAFTTACGTHVKAEAVTRWMQFPDCAYLPPASQQAAQAVPEGFALVRTPITEEMHVAAVRVLLRAPGLAGLPQRMLDAMLRAAKGEQ